MRSQSVKFRSFAPVTAALALSAIALATPAFSAPVSPLYSSVNYLTYGNGFYVNDNDFKQDNTEVQVQGSATAYSLLARAQTDFGVNKAYASATTTDVYAASVSASSSWLDFLTITEAGKSGAGTVRYQFRLDGTLQGDNASSYFEVYHDGQFVPLTDIGGSIYETADLTFFYGEAFTLRAGLFVSVEVNGVADFFNTAELVAITPAGAEAAQLTAQDGGDSFAPAFQGGAAVVAVPESGTFALALPALGMLGSVIVRRRKGNG